MILLQLKARTTSDANKDETDAPQPMEVDGEKPPTADKLEQKPAGTEPTDEKKDAPSQPQQNGTPTPPPPALTSKPSNETNSMTSLKELARISDNEGYTPLLTCIQTYAETAEVSRLNTVLLSMVLV